MGHVCGVPQGVRRALYARSRSPHCGRFAHIAVRYPKWRYATMDVLGVRCGLLAGDVSSALLFMGRFRYVCAHIWHAFLTPDPRFAA
jgi:hypothetical protein